MVPLGVTPLPALMGVVRGPVLRWAAASLHTSSVSEAARKGTRAKAEAKKKALKKEEVKREFIPLKQRLELKQSGGRSPRRYEDHLKNPIDDVWFGRFYRRKVYSVEEAISMHRETHHPTQVGYTDALVDAVVELNMTADKKNRFLDDFHNVVRLAHDFDTTQERTILVVSRSEEVQEQARKMGAAYAVGLEIIKQAQNGEIDLKDYEHYLAETDTLAELVAIRGLIRKRFPAVRNGTAGSDVLKLLEDYKNGVEYRTTTDKYHHDYATIRAPIGRLSLSNEQLEENLAVLLTDIEKQKSQKKSDNLVTLVEILCPPTSERFKIDHTLYLQQATPVKVTAAA